MILQNLGEQIRIFAKRLIYTSLIVGQILSLIVLFTKKENFKFKGCIKDFINGMHNC